MAIEHVYIHIPFCLQKCGYCSFYSISHNIELEKQYLVTLHKEIDLYLKQFDIKPKTIYFGGGTPSLISPLKLETIIKRFDLAQTTEITIECNPVSITEKFVYELSQTSINRVSLGTQSFIPEELKMLGRLHTVEQADNAVQLLREIGIENISLDLIYALPLQTFDMIKLSLMKIIELNPEHISTYCLSLEQDVPLFNKIDELPDENSSAKFYEEIYKILEKSNYNLYEISNFSKLGKESQHNSSYWIEKEYLGLGAAASGMINDYRYTNPYSVNDYIEQVNDSVVVPNKESRDKETEFIMLRLRLVDGFSIDDYEERFSKSFQNEFGSKIALLLSLGYIAQKNGRIKLTPKAYFVSNAVILEILN